MDEKQTTSVKKTRIALVLDKSGSMKNVIIPTIRGFNRQLEVLKESGQEVTVTFTVFNRHTDIRYVDLPLAVVDELTEKSYQPEGDTALFDAVGRTIEQLQDLPKNNDQDIAYLVMIFSDAKERCSKEYTSESLSKLIKKLQDEDDWTFSYMGSNQDLAEVSRQTGIHSGNMKFFTSNGGSASKSTSKAFADYGDYTSRYMSARARGIKKVKDFTGEEGKVADTEIDKNPIMANEKEFIADLDRRERMLMNYAPKRLKALKSDVFAFKKLLVEFSPKNTVDKVVKLKEISKAKNIKTE